MRITHAPYILYVYLVQPDFPDASVAAFGWPDVAIESREFDDMLRVHIKQLQDVLVACGLEELFQDEACLGTAGVRGLLQSRTHMCASGGISELKDAIDFAELALESPTMIRS